MSRPCREMVDGLQPIRSGRARRAGARRRRSARGGGGGAFGAPAPGSCATPACPRPSRRSRIYYDYSAAQAERRARADAMRAASDGDAGADADRATLAAAGRRRADGDGRRRRNPSTRRSSPKRRRAPRRRLRGADRLRRAAGRVLVESFLRLGRQGLSVRASAGAFEREAIRPFVLGRFADMLAGGRAAIPAMLHFLDNAQSVGPDSLRRPARQARPQRESGARDPGIAHARRRRRLHARPTSPNSRAS